MRKDFSKVFIIIFKNSLYKIHFCINIILLITYLMNVHFTDHEFLLDDVALMHTALARNQLLQDLGNGAMHAVDDSLYRWDALNTYVRRRKARHALVLRTNTCVLLVIYTTTKCRCRTNDASYDEDVEHDWETLKPNAALYEEAKCLLQTVWRKWDRVSKIANGRQFHLYIHRTKYMYTCVPFPISLSLSL